jgi:hypothetical protein
VRDPYYRKILSGLEQLDNPAAFEECACDLLRDAFPSLAWVHGGSDAGMDGAIADGEGEAYPLIVTTGKDLSRNLRESLASYVRHGKERRRAVLATSRKVNPSKRRELEAIARDEQGFTLVNIYDQYDFAARLYRNSRWARELLGVTGEPPALSAVPRTRRPLPDIELVGRDADVQWLDETQGHRILVGQPGSGKTALFLQLVQDGEALFLASDNEERIAAAYRDFPPAVILADDAHFDPKKLTRLVQIRAELGAEFDIVASAWPGTEDEVSEALGGLGSGNIHKLELLTRAEIVKVLRAIGISEPDDDPYLGLLVDQSANKPGLAVTLGSLWLRGEGIDVLTGKALRRSLIPALKRVLEYDPTQLLACFALGGDCGMGLETVGEFLEIGLAEVQRRASLASQGGVLSVHRDNLLSVQPEALRSALLAEVFFTPPSLSYRPLLERAPNLGCVVETLAMAALRGASVPRDELSGLLLQGGSRQAWQVFALLGETEGRWVLENSPDNIAAMAPQLLQSSPRPTIRRLLSEAEGAEGPLHSQPTHPLRLLQDWVRAIPDPRHQPDPIRESLRRRRTQIEEAREYLRSGGDRTVGLRACILALSARLEGSGETATGGGIVFREGLLPTSSIPQILELWIEVRRELGQMTPETWSELEQILQDWVWPNILGRELSETETNDYRVVARRIVSDLADSADEHQGLALALRKWADWAELSLPIPENQVFAAIFPPTENLTPDTWEEEKEKQRLKARELATRWALRPPLEVAQELNRFADEARVFGHRESDATSEFFQTLAGQIEAPENLLNAFLEERLPASWLGPVLERVVRQRHEGWQQILEHCLEVVDYTWLAGDIVIRTEGISRELIDAALSRLSAGFVEDACLRRQVALDTLEVLLTHEREDIAVAAAIGEWLSEPKGEVRSEIHAQWRTTMLRFGSAGRVERSLRGPMFWLKEILSSDPHLALAWLKARFKTAAGYEPVLKDGLYAAAIRPLANNQREELLRELPENGFEARLVALLIGDSPQLYRWLLTQDRSRGYDLSPLVGRPPDSAWIQLARLALEAGKEPRAIAEVAFYYEGSYSGHGVEHWGKWETAFRKLLEPGPDGLQEVAQYGLEFAEARIREAKARERAVELTGRL